MKKIRRSLKKMHLKAKRMFISVPHPQKWIFLVGCYNSGTTLLHKLLSEYPNVGSMPFEGQFYTKELLLPKNMGYKRLWALKPELFVMNDTTDYAADAHRLKKDWAVMYNNPKAAFLLEKSPTNAGRMLWLQKNFPNAHFLCIVRNGYAVAEGIKRKTGHPIEKCAQQWNDSNKIMMDDFSKIKNAYLIYYEKLTENPLKELSQIADFIGLDSEQTQKIVNQNFKIHEQNTKIENKNARSYRDLSEDEVEKISTICHEMLEYFGYNVKTFEQ